ncbi:unnamed protein product [Hymenolepis diminuta]|uniref:Uncharacterized protein n=1 Tax=Hymenolepis diminuta TaxID=6216 RepID=A0A564Z7W2_HYMDI|nr:unnamed protein product [Hymenolepis diminuta]
MKFWIIRVLISLFTKVVCRMTISGRSTPETWRQEKIEEEFSRIRNALSDPENLMLRYVDRVGNNFLFQEYHLAKLYFIVKLPKNYPEDIPKYSFEVERVAIRKFANENPRTDVNFTRVVLRRFFEISMARQIDIPEKIIALDREFLEECRKKEAQMMGLL